MKQAISGTWVYITVLIFMVVLIAYVTISINYANAYELSEEVIKAIEQYEGYNPKSRKQIKKILSGNVHTSRGGCAKKEGQLVVGGYDEQPDKNLTRGAYDYCISRTVGNADGVPRYYYETTIFFSFSLPVLGDLFTFKIPGQTAGMRNIYDDVFDNQTNN